MKPFSNRQGLTLLELLITCAVIATLAMILLPLFGHLRKESLRVQSANHLRQVGNALLTYIAENNGKIMPVWDPSKASTSRYWTAILFNRKYLANANTFYDPRIAPFRADNSAKSLANNTPESYGMRGWVAPGQYVTEENLYREKAISLVENPNVFFVLADSWWLPWNAPGYGIMPGHTGRNNMRIRLDERGMAGTWFLDGHFEWVRSDYFKTLHETQPEYSAGQPFYVWTPSKDQEE